MKDFDASSAARRLSSGKVRLRVRFPSGQEFTIWGQLYQLYDPALDFAPIVDRGNAGGRDHGVVVLDPRAIVYDEQGAALYRPRATHVNFRAPWVIEWLAEHREWDAT